MLSRVESIKQLFILEEFDENKVYGNQDAIKELEKMNKLSVNERPTTWYDKKISQTRISLLNCGSLRPKWTHICSDMSITLSDIICLTETWIWDDEESQKFKLQGFVNHHNAQGRGQGISVYWRRERFKHRKDLKKEKLQVTAMSSTHLDLIVVYKSPTGKDSDLCQMFQTVINPNRPTIVCGDFNLCFIEDKNCKSISCLINMGFKQLVQVSTHIEGRHIDHVYVLDLQAHVELYSPYYTAKDHDGLLITIKDGIMNKEVQESTT